MVDEASSSVHATATRPSTTASSAAINRVSMVPLDVSYYLPLARPFGSLGRTIGRRLPDFRLKRTHPRFVQLVLSRTIQSQMVPPCPVRQRAQRPEVEETWASNWTSRSTAHN